MPRAFFVGCCSAAPIEGAPAGGGGGGGVGCSGCGLTALTPATITWIYSDGTRSVTVVPTDFGEAYINWVGVTGGGFILQAVLHCTDPLTLEITARGGAILIEATGLFAAGVTCAGGEKSPNAGDHMLRVEIG